MKAHQSWIIAILGLFLVIIAASGWIFFITTRSNYEMNLRDKQIQIDTLSSSLAQKKDEATKLSNDLQIAYSTVDMGKTDLAQKDDEIGKLTANIEQSKEQYTDLSKKYLDLKSELDDLNERLTCSRGNGMTYNYQSNATISENLKEFVGDVGGSTVDAEWDVIWNNTKAAIHKIHGEKYLYVFVVTFEDDDIGNPNSVFWVDAMCFLDYQE